MGKTNIIYKWKVVLISIILLILIGLSFMLIYKYRIGETNKEAEAHLPHINRKILVQKITFNITEDEAKTIARKYLVDILGFKNYRIIEVYNRSALPLFTGERYYSVFFANGTGNNNYTTIIRVDIDAYKGYIIGLRSDITFDYKCRIPRKSINSSNESELEINISKLGYSEEYLEKMLVNILKKSNSTFLLNPDLTFKIYEAFCTTQECNSITIEFIPYYKGYGIMGMIYLVINPCLNNSKYYSFTDCALPVWVFEDLDRYVKLEYKISSEDAVGIAINYLKEMIKNSSQYYGSKLVKYNYTVKKPKILRYIDINRDGIVDYMAPIYVVEIHYLTDKREGTITITIDAYSGLIV